MTIHAPTPRSSRPVAALLTSLGFVAAAALGCADRHASDDPPPDDMMPESEITSLCDAYRAGCERQIVCGIPVHNTETTVEACVVASGCAELEATLLEHEMAFQVDVARRCIEEVTAATCDRLVFAIDGEDGEDGAMDGHATIHDLVPECGEIYAGTRDAGSPCADDGECAQGLVCADPVLTCPGTCTPRCPESACGADEFCDDWDSVCSPRAAGGQPCEGDEFENTCVDGYRCVWEEGASRCIPQIPAGAPCHEGDLFACADNTVCDFELNACAPPHAIGEQCTTGSECVLGAFCELSEGLCRAWGEDGDRCSNAWSACGPGLKCEFEPGLGCLSSVDCSFEESCCGGVCVTSDSDECVEPRGVCRPEGREPELGEVTGLPAAELGESCSDAVCRLGLACDPIDGGGEERRCVTAPRLGESCELNIGGTDPLEDLLTIRAFERIFGCAEGLCDIVASTPTCVESKPPGATCDAFGFTPQCQSRVCFSGVCVDYLTCFGW